jgi:hypothetical protein
MADQFQFAEQSGELAGPRFPGHSSHLLHHVIRLGVAIPLTEVAQQSIAEILGLANVYEIAKFVDHAVDAGSSWSFLADSCPQSGEPA